MVPHASFSVANGNDVVQATRMNDIVIYLALTMVTGTNPTATPTPVPYIEVVLDSKPRLLVHYGYETVWYPCAYGRLEDGRTVTPAGVFKVISKTKIPQNDAWLKLTYGTRLIRLNYHPSHTDRHLSIHGTGQPELIGKPVSNMCIRLRNADIEAIYDKIPVGTEVRIRKVRK